MLNLPGCRMIFAGEEPYPVRFAREQAGSMALPQATSTRLPTCANCFIMVEVLPAGFEPAVTGRKPVDLGHLSTGAYISSSSGVLLVEGFMVAEGLIKWLVRVHGV